MATSNNAVASSNVAECSICLSPLSQPNMDIFTTSCQHQFHFQCLAKNVQAQNAECPLCRTHLASLAQLINGSPAASVTIPSQKAPLELSQSIPTQPTSRSSGLWSTLRRSISRVFSGRNNTSARPISSSSQTRRTPTRLPSSFGPSVEDLVDEAAARALSDRINAARQRSIEGQTELPLITATTTLEFGGQESGKDSNIYGMVSLKAPSLLPSTASEKELDELRVPIDLICIVDQSGSMQGDKITLLKETLNYIVDQMNSSDRLAIVSFDTKAYNRSEGLKLMTLDKKEHLRTIIRDNIAAGGGTHIGSGLEMAIQLFTSRRTVNTLGAMLLLTDGQDNTQVDYGSLMKTLPDGVVCHTFGYGLGHNTNLLSQLAEQGHDGTFTYIDQFDAIGPAFATALGSLFTCIATQVRVKLEFENGYQVTNSHSAYPIEPTTLPSQQMTLKLTDLNADEKRNLVFQLKVPKLDRDTTTHPETNHIGRVSVKYIDPNSQRTMNTPDVPFTLARPDQIDPRSPLVQMNYTLDVQRNRTETSQVLQQAVKTSDYQLARQMIDVQLAKIRASASAADPFCQQLIQDLEHRQPSQQVFQSVMTNMCIQQSQERATYTSACVGSSAIYKTAGQQRFLSKFRK